MIPSVDNISAIQNLFEITTLTLKQIAIETNTSQNFVWKVVAKSFTPEQRKARKVRNYRISKLGDKNPMKGKFGNQHPRYKGEIPSARGYLMILKPDWYTGRKRSKHVFVHHVVMCEALGLTEMPKGWEVHHIDKNKQNNNPDNLALVTSKGHQKIHAREGVTTRRKP